MQATEPYNNEESASRDEGGMAADAQISPDNNMDNIENMDNIDRIDNIDKIGNIDNIDNTSQIDNLKEVWTGGIDADENRENMRKSKNGSETVIDSNTTAKAVNEMERKRSREKEGVEVNNIKEVKAINLVSKTRTATVSTDGLVEVERLRTQVISPSKKVPS